MVARWKLSHHYGSLVQHMGFQVTKKTHVIRVQPRLGFSCLYSMLLYISVLQTTVHLNEAQVHLCTWVSECHSRE
ncbi:hypothetical protein DPEC_G00225360 [Dallia pectoralis]|uniref:Uncharacterized protein n=1 Tax=Dallia pectoralis TaxID=75939 RepID=A0ACC2G0Q5_DALPE|nr:hypothetical protein DPEC_G00225360 [Dallia pectoralis]